MLADTTETRQTLPWPVLALLGWALPGLGHWVLGERRRARIVGSTILGLFVGGLLVGGVDVVDYRQDKLWFAGQALVGPVALGVGYWHTLLDDPSPPEPDRGPAYVRSVGRVNELGTLWCTLAGVLNLLVILDAVSRSAESDKQETET